LIPPTPGLQDQVFTANAGVVIGNDVIVSHHATAPRHGETAAAVIFFRQFSDLKIHRSPAHFEGEADFKHLHDRVWIGGYGQRSTESALQWIGRYFDVEIVPVQMEDPYLYHLDCLVFPITPTETLVCTKLLSRAEVKAIGRHTNIVDVTIDEAFSGITNNTRVGSLVLNGSHIHELQSTSKDYREERAKNRRLEDICAARDLEARFVNVSEYHKGGALLSCLVMKLRDQ
jgi:N-dimethylarginine dimethylaminohydrolase